MTIRIAQHDASTLGQYVKVPIVFRVESVLRVEVMDGGLGGFVLSEQQLAQPYVKDYDAYESPLEWATFWDISHWPLFVAFDGAKRVGGAIVAWRTSEISMLEGRDDVAALWDIRVHPDHRRQGIGAKLLEAAAAWARQRGCRVLKIETQNNNVPACRFYANQGCQLISINRHAYAELPDETELLWRLDL